VREIESCVRVSAGTRALGPARLGDDGAGCAAAEGAGAVTGESPEDQHQCDAAEHREQADADLGGEDVDRARVVRTRRRSGGGRDTGRDAEGGMHIGGAA
jgi:hypothetical protein